MEQAKAAGYDLVTLCHQDDLYLPGYGAAVQAMASPDMLIYFLRLRGKARRRSCNQLPVVTHQAAAAVAHAHPSLSA